LGCRWGKSGLGPPVPLGLELGEIRAGSSCTPWDELLQAVTLISATQTGCRAQFVHIGKKNSGMWA
jgi:hypothetical protein